MEAPATGTVIRDMWDRIMPSVGVSGGGLSSPVPLRQSVSQQQPLDNLPSYDQGGLVGPGGQPVVPPGATPQVPNSAFTAKPVGLPTQGAAPADPQMLQGEMQQAIQNNPQQTQAIQKLIMAALQSGQLTEQNLHKAIQLAKIALQNPASWPQVRAFAIQHGLATEEQLPQQFDQGLCAALVMAGMAMEAVGAQGAQPRGGLAVNMQSGGTPGQSNSPDGGILAKVHQQEYVMPKEAVLHYGTDKLNKMVEKARFPNGKPGAGNQSTK